MNALIQNGVTPIAQIQQRTTFEATLIHPPLENGVAS
jgi:hypothetical protein